MSPTLSERLLSFRFDVLVFFFPRAVAPQMAKSDTSDENTRRAWTGRQVCDDTHTGGDAVLSVDSSYETKQSKNKKQYSVLHVITFRTVLHCVFIYFLSSCKSVWRSCKANVLETTSTQAKEKHMDVLFLYILFICVWSLQLPELHDNCNYLGPISPIFKVFFYFFLLCMFFTFFQQPEVLKSCLKRTTNRFLRSIQRNV